MFLVCEIERIAIRFQRIKSNAASKTKHKHKATEPNGSEHQTQVRLLRYTQERNLINQDTILVLSAPIFFFALLRNILQQ